MPDDLESTFIPILDALRAHEEQADKDSREARRARNWGGPRPGSGPPKGNLNALKHGRYSQQQASLLAALLEVPQARDALIRIARKNQRRRKEAEEGAGIMLVTLLEKAAAAALRPSPGQPAADIPLPEGEGQTASGLGPRPASADTARLSSPLPRTGESLPAEVRGPGVRAQNNQDMNDQDFLDFLNAATTEIRRILEKPPKRRRISIKPSISPLPPPRERGQG
jgi:hypothetical protein